LKIVDEGSNAQYADSDRPFLKDVVEKAVLARHNFLVVLHSNDNQAFGSIDKLALYS
jgi:hypothetical protein